VSFLNFTAHPKYPCTPHTPHHTAPPKPLYPHPNKKQIPSLSTLHALCTTLGIFDLASPQSILLPHCTPQSILLPHCTDSFSLFSHKPFSPRHPFLLFSSTHHSSPHRRQPPLILSRGFSIFAGKSYSFFNIRQCIFLFECMCIFLF